MDREYKKEKIKEIFEGSKVLVQPPKAQVAYYAFPFWAEQLLLMALDSLPDIIEVERRK